MEQRRLGRTGHAGSVVTLGGFAVGFIPQEEADRTVQLALDHGINRWDVAPSYGGAELRLGPWVERHRDEVFLSCKTTERTREGAWADLQRSLERLRTDHFDLYQLHAVGTRDDLDAALATGGAIEALLRAREEGLTRFLGITGHGLEAPATHAEALSRFPFDTVMFPLNFVLYADEDYRRDSELLLDLCVSQDVGVYIIKTAARAPWEGREQTFGTWYEPFVDQEHIDRAVRFVLSQRVTTLCSPGDPRLLGPVINAAERFQPLSADEERALVGTAPQYGNIFA